MTCGTCGHDFERSTGPADKCDVCVAKLLQWEVDLMNEWAGAIPAHTEAPFLLCAWRRCVAAVRFVLPWGRA